MSLPTEFQFKTQVAGPFRAIKTNNGYLVVPFTSKIAGEYSEKSVRKLLDVGTWIMYKEIPTKNINFEQPPEDIVNKPNHYHEGGIDVIGFAEMKFSKEELKGFYRINCLKYITRFDKKNGTEDLRKASFYLNKLLELETS